MDPELNRYVLLNEAKGLVPGYPQSMLDILGKCNIAAVYGSSHKHLRSNMLSLVGTPLIKDRLLPRINRYVKLHLRNWDGSTVDIQEKTMNVSMNFKMVSRSQLLLYSPVHGNEYLLTRLHFADDVLDIVQADCRS